MRVLTPASAIRLSWKERRALRTLLGILDYWLALGSHTPVTNAVVAKTVRPMMDYNLRDDSLLRVCEKAARMYEAAGWQVEWAQYGTSTQFTFRVRNGDDSTHGHILPLRGMQS